MAEYWDVYDRDRNKTGKIAQRGANELGEGEYHMICQSLILNSKDEILICQRTPNKNFGLMWDCGGGSALKGETSLDGMLRELKEEIGLTFTKKDAMFLKVVYRDVVPCNFKDIWVFRKDVDVSELKFQAEEVLGAKWVTIDEFLKMQKNNEIVPVIDIVEEDYYDAIKLKPRETYSYIGETTKVTIDRPLDSYHPKFDMKYPVNYGFVPNTISADGEEIDCYVLGVDKPLKEFEGECIAVIHRTNDDDDKLIIAPKGMNFTDEEIESKTNFQEKYFKSEIIR